MVWGHVGELLALLGAIIVSALLGDYIIDRYNDRR